MVRLKEKDNGEHNDRYWSYVNANYINVNMSLLKDYRLHSIMIKVQRHL
jgi:hypothetical protein